MINSIFLFHIGDEVHSFSAATPVPLANPTQGLYDVNVTEKNKAIVGTLSCCEVRR